jgi:hypothetical protein
MNDDALNFDDLLNDQPINEDESVNEYESRTEADLDLDTDDSEVETEQETEEEPSEDIPDYKDNSLYSFLQSRGVSDPKKIQMKNEDGTVDEVDFGSLTPEEQLEILQAASDPGLTSEEIDTINLLRNNKMNLKQAMESYAQQMLDAYLSEHPEAVHQKNYQIDDYTDDDLYLVDLKMRYPDFTDEELLSKLDEAKANESLFKKEAEVLRNTYKAREDQAEADRVQREQQQAEDLRNNLVNAASNFNEVQLDYTDDQSDSLLIEDADKRQMISYILDQDENGKSQLVKDLEDPNSLIELAWLRTQGAEVLSNITKYWKNTLATERAENKKLRAQIEKINKKSNSSVVVPQPPTREKSSNKSVWDNSGLI